MANIKQDIKNIWFGLCESTLNSIQDFVQFFKEAWLILILLLTFLMAVWWYSDPPPPSHIAMATGASGGNFHELGEKYAKYFKARGITIEQVETEGAVENFNVLANPKNNVQAALIQAGTIDPAVFQSKGIVSLGAIQYNPIWFFYRGPLRKEIDFEAEGGQLKYWSNLKISIGSPGSGAYAIATIILSVSGVDVNNPQFVELPVKESVEAIQNGGIDAMFMADAGLSSNALRLLEDPAIHLGVIKRSQGYAYQLPFLQVITIPEGGINMARHIPAEDVGILISTSHLVVNEKLHPAIQYLFIAAEKEINGQRGFLSRRGEFPAFKGSGLPESPVFLRYEQNGQPWLMNYFPFWLAELLNRLAVLVLPFLVVIYPLLSSLPKFKTNRIMNRINRMYGVLKGYEVELANGYDPRSIGDYLKKLDDLEHQALKLDVPKSMSNEYYALRTNINYVRDCLSRGEKPYVSRNI